MSQTLPQRTALAVIPKCTAGISVLCSSTIVCLVARDKNRRSKVFHRLILGLSLTDVITSSWWVMSTWPIPKESGVLWAIGSTASCTAQGFFLQLGIANPLYNLSVSVYYLMAVHYAWGEDKLKRIEPFFHLGPLGWGIITAIIGLPLKIFNNAGLWCWIADFPGRNENTQPFRWGIFYAPLWLAFVLVSICLFKLVVHFRQVTTTMEKHIAQAPEMNVAGTHSLSDRTEGSLGKERVTKEGADEHEFPMHSEYWIFEENNDLETIAPSVASNKKNCKRFAAERRRLTFNCMRYALVFYITWFPITLLRIFQAVRKPVPYFLVLSAAFLTPLQGFPNFLVYLFPLLLKKMQKLRSSRYCCCKKSVDEIPEVAPAMEEHTPNNNQQKSPCINLSRQNNDPRFVNNDAVSSIIMSEFATFDADLTTPEARWNGIEGKSSEPTDRIHMENEFEGNEEAGSLPGTSNLSSSSSVSSKSSRDCTPSRPLRFIGEVVSDEELQATSERSASSKGSSDRMPSRPLRFISEVIADKELHAISENEGSEEDSDEFEVISDNVTDEELAAIAKDDFSDSESEYEDDPMLSAHANEERNISKNGTTSIPPNHQNFYININTDLIEFNNKAELIKSKIEAINFLLAQDDMDEERLEKLREKKAKFEGELIDII